MDTDYIKIPLTTDLDSENANISRWERQKGHFNLTIAVILPANRNVANLRHSIMPLGKNGDTAELDPDYAVLADQLSQGNPMLIVQNPCPEIRLAFTNMGRFTALRNKLHAHANNIEPNSQVIGVTAFWQPDDGQHKFYDGDEALPISEFIANNRKLDFNKRSYIDAHYLDVADILEQTRNLMLDTVLEAGLKLDADSIVNNYKPQHACSTLANRYPFVLQHVFKYLPSLNILKLGLNVLGSDNAIYVYRHKPHWFSGAHLIRTSSMRNIDLEILV